MNAGEMILYTTEDGNTAIQLRAEEGTVWLSQLEMTELFQTSKQNISLHIKNILLEGEQDKSVVKYHLTTAADGKSYRVKVYNLNMILAVGYRVASHRGTQFRKWATAHLSYRSLDSFWDSLGYPIVPNWKTYMGWLDIGSSEKESHLMRFRRKQILI